MSGRRVNRGRATVPAAALALAAALGACDTAQLPPGAALTITPEEQSYTVPDRRDDNGLCLIDPNLYVDLPLVFALRDAQGSPIGDAELSVYVDFGDNTYGGYPVLELYEDVNGNGVVDPESELVSGEGDEIARVRTDRYGGDAVLLLRMNLSCGYRGGVIGFVDGVSAGASFEVKPEDEPPSAPSEWWPERFGVGPGDGA